MLCGIFAWGLLFVVIFVYFTDSNPAEPVPSSFSFLETRRLLPVQGKQRAIMGALQEPSPPDSGGANRGLPASGPFPAEPGALQKWALVQDGLEDEDKFFAAQIGRKSQSAFYPEEDDYFFAAGQPGSQSHTQRTWAAPPPGKAGSQEGAWLAKQARRGQTSRRSQKQGRRRVPEDGNDAEQLYSPMSRAFLQRLWSGDVSSRMLAPRLQKAMRDYVSANKHGVRFRGRRTPGRSHAQLMCALRHRVRVRTLDGREPPFAALGWRELVPAVPLRRLLTRGLHSCAVVTSAGAILNSSLGEEIGGCPGRAGASSASTACLPGLAAASHQGGSLGSQTEAAGSGVRVPTTRQWWIRGLPAGLPAVAFGAAHVSEFLSCGSCSALSGSPPSP